MMFLTGPWISGWGELLIQAPCWETEVSKDDAPPFGRS
jgi:hypothetical protein